MMQYWEWDGLTFDVSETILPTTNDLNQWLSQRLNRSPDDIQDVQLLRRALDVRNKKPCYRLRVRFAMHPQHWQNIGKKPSGVRAVPPPTLPTGLPSAMLLPTATPRWQPVVVGMGPAGLFAALVLAEAGWPATIIERGKAVRERAKDVSRLYRHGELNPNSNVCFGEGGAGTFSDGKLYTRVGGEEIPWILHRLVEAGANPDILVDHRPHIGTNRLIKILESLRNKLLGLGTRIEFNTQVVDFKVEQGALKGLCLADGRIQDAQAVVLATGHSAPDIWYRLQEAGAVLTPRPFAVGFRIEHPQALINVQQYGKKWAECLPAASYELRYNESAGETQRGVYSFCMCPGGVVVSTPTLPNALCINGMSHSTRSGRFANSALVVSCTPQDLAQWGYSGLFAGLAFQTAMEARAYEWGGGDYQAPAIGVVDFMNHRLSTALQASSYRRGLNPAPLYELYPQSLTEALQRALRHFAKRMPNMVGAAAQFIGVETRTASCIRVERGADGQAHGLSGVYPAGEGMGFGGGIMSAAIDGVRAAMAMLRHYTNSNGTLNLNNSISKKIFSHKHC
jgi:uncharacterized FAD-dependent dehydrogenase